MLRHTFLCFLLALFFCSCKKDDSNQIDPPDPPVVVDTSIIALGKASVLRNGVLYTGIITAKYREYNGVNTFRISGTKFSSGGLIDETFSISDIPLQKGKYPIEQSSATGHGNGIPQAGIGWIVDTDQFAGGQLPDTSRTDHYFEVIRYDSVKHIAEGRFQVFLKNYKNSPILPGIPDTISFTQGKFHLNISN
jgi:hypothetical protein